MEDPGGGWGGEGGVYVGGGGSYELCFFFLWGLWVGLSLYFCRRYWCFKCYGYTYLISSAARQSACYIDMPG